jgi:2-polyprenyl-6-hydroxyphenyl methylase/3-demethylubiquinone-9 3-methyltransferase
MRIISKRRQFSFIYRSFHSSPIAFNNPIENTSSTKASQNSVDAEEMKRFAEQSKEWYNLKGPYEVLFRMNPLRTNYITKKLNNKITASPLQNIKILDIGCGGGFLSNSLTRLGATVTGLDANRENILTAKANNRQNIEYINSTAEELLLLGKQYDCVCALEIVEHVTDPKDFVKVCNALVKPGGYIFYSTINRTLLGYLGTIAIAENILGWVPKGTHTFEKYVKPEELTRYIEDSGAKVLDVTGMGYNPLTKQWSLEGCEHPQMNYIVTAQRLPDKL